MKMNQCPSDSNDRNWASRIRVGVLASSLVLGGGGAAVACKASTGGSGTPSSATETYGGLTDADANLRFSAIVDNGDPGNICYQPGEPLEFDASEAKIVPPLTPNDPNVKEGWVEAPSKAFKDQNVAKNCGDTVYFADTVATLIP